MGVLSHGNEGNTRLCLQCNKGVEETVEHLVLECSKCQIVIARSPTPQECRPHVTSSRGYDMSLISKAQIRRRTILIRSVVVGLSGSP
ncbi:hypothetical protein FHG87_002751 [Trinorchestia longiramus]|nr:hypothetical protein FHG87_002751 [Trinorchestia longiramus]